MAKSKVFEKLPGTVKPIHYDIFLEPNLEAFTFEGKENIQIEVFSAINEVIFHSCELVIKEAELTLPCGETLTPKITLVPEDELLILSFSKTLPLGLACLSCIFSGELNDKMKGFYRSKYNNRATKQACYAAVTQFAPTDARKCFPCWDEPAIKSVFSITLCVEPNKVALSNMPVASESVNEEGKKILKFEKSPIMSTYLVAVVVGEFDWVEERSCDDVLVRVYTPIGKKDQGKFALHIASKVLPYYKEYFQISYPLPKMDLIALGDLSYGAMENWGLITYRESRVLIDDANSSAITKQEVALVVGHEIAHQWFGNLVTMEWWTHLWLNEGYATFVENLCVAHLCPEYDIWTQFVSAFHINALESDALQNSHPIEVPINHPSEINEIFDSISYCKGASVIRMLHKFIGDENFRKGMHLYLTKYLYKNASTDDLWAALEEISSKPVKDLMSGWTRKMGFPVITVESSKQVNNTRELTVSQTKYFANGTVDGNNFIWSVPLTFSKASSPNEECYSTVLKDTRATIIIPNVKSDEWIKINPGVFGFYRTQYPSEILQQFVPAMENKELPPMDRLGLLDDVFALVQSGEISTVEALKLMQSMTNEDSYIVWSSISNFIRKISILISGFDFEHLFHKYGLILMDKIYEKLGWNAKTNESHFDTLLRPVVIGFLGQFGNKEIIAEAKKRFEKHIVKEEIIPADLRDPVYKTALCAGDESTFEFLLKIYCEEELREEKNRISSAFGVITDEKILTEILEFTISEKVRPQDSVSILVCIGRKKIGRELVWNFIKKNWLFLKNRYGSGPLLIQLVKRCTENFSTEEKAIDVENFFKLNATPGLERSIQQSCESIRIKAAWLKRDSAAIENYLSNF